MPGWPEFEPFIVSGLALGGVYALSGVGLVVLYRATGVLYLAFMLAAIALLWVFRHRTVMTRSREEAW